MRITNFNWKLLGLVAALLAQASCATAQNQNVVKKVFALSSGTQNSSNLPNSGFGQHFLQATVSESGGTCNTSTVATLQGSTDGTTYFGIAQPIALNYAGGILTGNVFTNGVYPFIRVAMVSTQAACKYVVYYIGSVNPISNPQATLNTSNYATIGATATADVGGLWTTIATNPTTAGKYVVYGAAFTNQDSADAGTFQIMTGNCSSTTTASGPLIRVVASQASVILPTSIVPYFTGFAGSNLCIQGVSAAASSAYITLTYRLE